NGSATSHRTNRNLRMRGTNTASRSDRRDVVNVKQRTEREKRRSMGSREMWRKGRYRANGSNRPNRKNRSDRKYRTNRSNRSDRKYGSDRKYRANGSNRSNTVS
ncbi:hypothetical protein, partial [Clostridioides difficile]|uniref:hypothetical protein n=1 Tax=Clostridioides difficile TaxID=1496 RepID=UPI001C00106C